MSCLDPVFMCCFAAQNSLLLYSIGFLRRTLLLLRAIASAGMWKPKFRFRQIMKLIIPVKHSYRMSKQRLPRC
ncbi:hypothetical protein EUGRSUZ_G02308 [Eucalyptus grandis]|uniref:Uncharacterized protein n=2 Tax=Eucalyptus grandis TaxID=71139 RepID=A0ACC3K615_EUCGR|nr:hypothetical protein EUGRSUZ_G02308 [Eucalyptus grandis]